MTLLRRLWSRSARDRRGVAAMEMAVVALGLILLVLTCVDVGRGISRSIDLNHAVRAGAQYAVVAPDATSKIEEEVRNALPLRLRNGLNVQTTCFCGPLPGGSGMPAEASCAAHCPFENEKKEKNAKLTTLRAQIPFTTYNFVSATIATSFDAEWVSSDVTIRHW